MNRTVIARTLVALAILSGTLKWVPVRAQQPTPEQRDPAAPEDTEPSEEGAKAPDPLESELVTSEDKDVLRIFGDAWKLMRDNRDCLKHDDFDARRAFLLSGDVPANVAFWDDVFEAVRGVRAAARPGDVVQSKGVPRNVLWMMRYYLYPLRIIGKTQEEGSWRRDPTLPDADFVIYFGYRFGWVEVER